MMENGNFILKILVGNLVEQEYQRKSKVREINNMEERLMYNKESLQITDCKIYEIKKELERFDKTEVSKEMNRSIYRGLSGDKFEDGTRG